MSTQFPKQRLPLSKKGKDWRENHLKWAENVRYLNNGKIRKSLINKKVNFDLYAGKLHLSDLKLYLNPYDKISSYIPSKIQHYPVMNQALDLLVGEEINSKGNMIAKVINPDAISQLEEQKTSVAKQIIIEFASKDIPQDQEQQEATAIQKYLNYKYQDIREVNANWLLKDAMRAVDFDRKLQEGFKHVLICLEEIYLFGIASGEPFMELINPKKVYTFRGGQSSRLEDSDIILIDDYWSPGKIVDVYFADLKESDRKYLDDVTSGAPVGNTFIDDTMAYITLPSEDLIDETLMDGYIGIANELGLPKSDYVDADGNIRVLKVFWRSQRKLLKLRRFDSETGDPIEEYVSESYRPNKNLGEEVETYWVNEWWSGTKIGKEIYVNIKPLDLQYRRMHNPSACTPPIVGQVYNTNQLRGQSMVDKMKPLQYLYDTIMDRMLKLIANHIGKVPEIDLAKVAWDDIDKFIHFVRTEQVAFMNSFKENLKGVASGQYNTVGGGNFDFDQSQGIQQYAVLLQQIKNQMMDMVGITPQRLGEISSRETVGGTERSVTQSSHTTAELRAIHNNVKKRCAEKLLETAKYAIKGNKKKVPYVTTEGISAILEIDGDEFAERDYGIYVENDLDLQGIRQKLEAIAQAWSQNETVKPSTIISIFEDSSIESIKRKLEQDFEDKVNEARQQAQMQEQTIQQQNQRLAEIEAKKMQLEQQKLQLEDLINERDNNTKLQIKMMELNNQQGVDNSSEIEKIQLQKEKIDKELQFKREQFYKDLDFENTKLRETIRHNKETEQISRIKKTSTK